MCKSTVHSYFEKQKINLWFFFCRPTDRLNISKKWKKVWSKFGKFSIYWPTDSTKMARQKSAMLKINWPWPKILTNFLDSVCTSAVTPSSFMPLTSSTPTIIADMKPIPHRKAPEITHSIWPYIQKILWYWYNTIFKMTKVMTIYLASTVLLGAFLNRSQGIFERDRHLHSCIIHHS